MIVAFSIVCEMTSKDSGTIGQGILSNNRDSSLGCAYVSFNMTTKTVTNEDECRRERSKAKKETFIYLLSYQMSNGNENEAEGRAVN